MTKSSWRSVPVVHVPRPRCPACGTPEYPRLVRSVANGDGSQTRRCVCRHCGQRFVLVMDPDLPTTGSNDDVSAYDPPTRPTGNHATV